MGEAMKSNDSDYGQEQRGFTWWTFSGWASLIVGTGMFLSLFKDSGVLAGTLAILNICMSVWIILFSRTAFIVGTIVSLNPLLWIINGIYIKNRWNDPRVLENMPRDLSQAPHPESRHLSTHHLSNQIATPVVKAARSTVEARRASIEESSEEPHLDSHSDEELWGKAMQEADSSLRRQGLWAKCFGEAKGVESAAKAVYMATRVEEMKLQLRTEHEEREAKRKADELERRIADLDEEQKAYERLPKGICPNCDGIIPLASADCPKCQAYFGPGSAWGVKPLE